MTSIRSLIIKVLDYYVMLEILKNIRLLFLSLGFDPKKN